MIKIKKNKNKNHNKNKKNKKSNWKKGNCRNNSSFSLPIFQNKPVREITISKRKPSRILTTLLEYYNINIYLKKFNIFVYNIL